VVYRFFGGVLWVFWQVFNGVFGGGLMGFLAVGVFWHLSKNGGLYLIIRK
jgi:hypothetical protein